MKKHHVIELFAKVCMVTIILLLTACGGNRTASTTGQGDTIPMRYAHNLTIVEHADYTDVFIRNPWDTTTVLHHYVLVDKNSKVSVTSVEGASLVNVPLQRVGVFTAVHCGLIKELGCESAIRGICEIEYINIPSIKQSVAEGRVANFGSAMQPSIEGIMDVSPDALLISPFENSGGYGRVERLGIPIIECADYMEYSPLARAEWMRFYGRLFGQSERADSLFAEVERRYLALRDRAQKAESHPTLLAEKPYSGVWYVPGGTSAMGVLYQDAGCHYLFRDRQKSGSLALSVESVFDIGVEADIWIIKYNQATPLTLDQLVTDYPPFAHFRSVVEDRVYGCNQSTSRFYEETPYHPDLLLADLVQIFHPELGIEAEKHYFCRLERQ